MSEPASADAPTPDLAVSTPSRHSLSRPRVIVAVLVAVTAVLVTAQFASLLSAGEGAVAGQGSSSTQSEAVTEYPPEERSEPLDLSGTGLTGEAIDVAAWRGDVVVINVWGSWCGPCRDEAPVLAATSSAYADKGVQFVGVNVRDNVAAAIAFEESYGIAYPSIDDRDGKAVLSLAEHLPGAGVPVTLVLDRDGRLAARVLGAVDESTLTALLDSALGLKTAGRS